MSVKEEKRVFFKNVELPALMGTTLKIMVGVSLACISLACLVYVLDVYDRYRLSSVHETNVMMYCSSNQRI